MVCFFFRTDFAKLILFVCIRRKKYAQIKHNLHEKTVIDECVKGFSCEKTTEEKNVSLVNVLLALLWIILRLTVFWPDSLKLKLLNDGFVSSSERLIQVCLRTYSAVLLECRFTVLNN